MTHTPKRTVEESLALCQRQIAELYSAIAHGDAEHRRWLKEKIDEHFCIHSTEKESSKQIIQTILKNTIDTIIREVSELDNVGSEDDPDMLLVRVKELDDILEYHLCGEGFDLKYENAVDASHQPADAQELVREQWRDQDDLPADGEDVLLAMQSGSILVGFYIAPGGTSMLSGFCTWSQKMKCAVRPMGVRQWMKLPKPEWMITQNEEVRP